MLTITVNTFENVDTKFHNDPMKTSGNMYNYFRGDRNLLLLNCSHFTTDEMWFNLWDRHGFQKTSQQNEPNNCNLICKAFQYCGRAQRIALLCSTTLDIL